MINAKTIGKWASIVGIVLAYLSFLGVSVHFLSAPSLGGINNGAQVQNYPFWFTNGFYAGSSQQFSVNSSGGLSLTGTFQIGANGTSQSNQVIKTCSMIANVSILATSTGYAYCTGVTGVTSSDILLAQFATSTAAITQSKDNWIIISSKASTTAGDIDFILYNATGATAVPSAVGQMGSTTDLFAAH